VTVCLCPSYGQFEFQSGCVSLLELFEIIKPHTAYGLVMIADRESCDVMLYLLVVLCIVGATESL